MSYLENKVRNVWWGDHDNVWNVCCSAFLGFQKLPKCTEDSNNRGKTIRNYFSSVGQSVCVQQTVRVWFWSVCRKCVVEIHTSLTMNVTHCHTLDMDVCGSVFTHAERPSTSSFVGMMPFLLRTAATLSISPRSTAFISRSSYLFQSVFW